MKHAVRLCGATTSIGTECKRAAAPGFTRCNLHGARSPQAIAAAERYLAFARVPAAEYLYNLIEQAMQDRCDTCGRGSGDPMPIIRAATAVLDRAGLHPTERGMRTGGQEPDAELEGLTLVELLEATRQVEAHLVAMLEAEGKAIPAGRAVRLLPPARSDADHG